MRAHPADLRRALEFAQSLAKAGIDFVPVPVMSDIDLAELTHTATQRLERMASESEEVEQ
jgi:hypothetical protein